MLKLYKNAGIADLLESVRPIPGTGPGLERLESGIATARGASPERPGVTAAVPGLLLRFCPALSSVRLNGLLQPQPDARVLRADAATNVPLTVLVLPNTVHPAKPPKRLPRGGNAAKGEIRDRSTRSPGT